ncbi:sensor histidine kinase [Brevundimonas goettingensis]|uniref:histidine kinase n=1 Tax=Brevundimonas goettingensis TaxID=2774190 RepID=A0A975C3P1_9CAUL|nr:ATP-binding protein [Brevundimonas goettingensis]QTC92297.1 sensor histidine kinase [Brevundimonas goettingensis]
MAFSDLQPRLSTVLRPTERPWIGLAVVWLVLAVGAALIAGELARRQAEGDLARQAQAGAALHAAVLRSELEKHRSLPLVLAQDPEAVALLTDPGPARTDQVDRKLERLAEQTRAAAIYLLDAKGVARAASNWRLPTSFVGEDYSFRPYFTRAMQTGDAEFFALGTVSGRPGLYLARRMADADGRVVGVAVVKVEFDALEADWRGSGEPAYVADPSGVILITSVPDWRFRTVAPMSDAQRRQVLTGQTLGHDALAPLPFRTADARPALVTAAVDGPPESWIAASADTATPGWTLHLLSPAGTAILVAVSNARAVALLAVTLLMGAVGVLLRRRQLAEAQMRAEEAARADLERRIDERTVELRAANDELNRQIDERRAAEAGREMLREELVQANKLATLGQIAAGVAHEINQPVAAIRTSAETVLAYLKRDDGEGVTRTANRIAELTARIGSITDELRAFSRKTTSRPSAVSPDEAIDGALVLLTGRLRASRIAVTRAKAPSLKVLADRVRLEQVILNLVQNAVEALDEAGVAEPRLSLSVAATGDGVEIVIADNGPGLSDEIAGALFTPFVTTKATGLGLGLVICRDIVASFGGELNTRPSDAGAVFVISLKAA